MAELFFMSPPGRTWALRGKANFRSREAPAVDPRAARREWLTLARRIEALGGTVVALPPVEGLTGLPYAAECGHVLAEPGRHARFLLPRMLAPHRQAERTHWEILARALGIEVIDPGEGIWEGQGDVAQFERVTLLFWGGRTDHAGMRAVATHLSDEWLEVEIREPAFHGNMAVLPLPAIDRLVVCPDVIAPASLERLHARFGRSRLLEVSEEEIRRYATNGLPIGKTLLAPSVLPARVRVMLEREGMTLVALPMAELCEKGGGAARCLVSRAVVDLTRLRIPAENRLAAVTAELESD